MKRILGIFLLMASVEFAANSQRNGVDLVQGGTVNGSTVTAISGMTLSGGGGGPAITAVAQVATGTDNGSVVLATINYSVTAGRCYVGFIKTETNGPLSVTMSLANTGTMTAMTDDANSTFVMGRFFYVASMPSSGATLFTPAAISGTAQYGRFYLIEVQYSGGTLTADIDDATGQGTSTGSTATSGTWSTAAAVAAVFAGCAIDNSRTFSSHTIAGSAATGVGTPIAGGDSNWFYSTFTSTQSSKTASYVISVGSSVHYVIPVFSIKVQ